MIVVQGLVPVHTPPDQPANVEPVLGVAVRVTLVSGAMLALQVEPQAIPKGDETDPDPDPDFVTERVKLGLPGEGAGPALLAGDPLSLSNEPPPHAVHTKLRMIIAAIVLYVLIFNLLMILPSVLL